ncbi:MAG: Dabb family protein [Actinomycetota bacterium]|nr:Dabb family protein [Actinomycetota bacterium]
MSLQHVVLFGFPEELPAGDDAELRRQVASWPAAIGGMTALRLGRPLSSERTRGYQYLLYMEFPDEAALGAYQQHPVHQAFVAWASERASAVLAFDYLLDAGTVIV